MSQALSAASLQQMIGRAGRGPPRAVSSSQGGSTLPLVGAYLAVSSRAEVGAAHTLHASKIADTGSALRGQLDLLTLFALKSQLARTVGQVEDFVGHSLFAQHFKGDVAQATRAMIRRLAAAGLLECGANEALTLRLRGEGYVAMELGVAGGLKFEERLSADLRPGLFLSSLVHPLLAFAAPGDTLSTAWSEIVRGIQLSGDPELRHLMSSLGVVGQCEITSGNIAALTKEPGDELKRRLLEALALNAMLVTQHDKASATAARAIGQEGMRKLLRDADLRCGNVCQFLKSMRRHQEYALAAKLKEMLHAALSADESSLIELRLICSLTDAQLLRKAGFSTIEQVATDQRVGSNCGKRGKGGAVAAAISKSRHGRIADWTTAARTCDRSKQAIVRTAMIIVKSARRLLGQRLQGHQRTLKAAKKAVATAARPRAARRKPTQTQAVARHMDNDLLSLCTEASSPQHVAGLDRVDVASGAAGAARAGAQQPPPVSLADFSAAVAAMASSGGIAFCVHSHKSRSSAAGGSAHEVLGVAVAGYAGTSTSQAASCAVRVFYVPLDAKQHGAQKRSREANDGDAQAQLRAAWAAVAGALLDSAGPCAAHNAKSQLALFADAARRATGEIIFARGKLRSVADPSVLALLLRGHEADAQQLFAMARQLGLVDETATHRQLAPTDAACFQAVLTLSVAAKLREDLARCPGPAPVASVQPKPPCSALIEEQMPAVLARMELEGIAIHTTVRAPATRFPCSLAALASPRRAHAPMLPSAYPLPSLVFQILAQILALM
ncbi:hypothetical protein T492DRAFT_147702 [Pavlovales sp. CCMP2436]|nr:hypothetical protein T492DRAFT_147702 [Pavlovales sp. CCMP2436]